MSNVTQIPRTRKYENEETGVVVKNSAGMEGTARKIAQDAPETVDFVVIKEDVAGHSRHVNIAYEHDAHDAQDYGLGELADTLEDYGFEQLGTGQLAAWGK